ncbi:MAG: hypothetical protein WDW38_003992 [Sanguina aurantia]
MGVLQAAARATQVAVMGGPRGLHARVKHSSWVNERKHLEAGRPAWAAEVLLCDQDGGILEGLLTNFCVVADHPEDPSRAALFMAPPSSPLLQGLHLQRVLQAAQLMGLPVVWQAPHPSQRSSWREAFLTNCLRGLQPVGEVRCPPDNFWGHAPWDVKLPVTDGEWTTRLRAAAKGLQQLTPAP